MGRWGDGEMGRLVLSKAVGAASRREVWGDGEMGRLVLSKAEVWGDEFFPSAPCPMPNFIKSAND